MSSPRRGGNEESILEMLERDTVRTRGMQGQSRFGWYVSGSVLAVFLVSLLVWLGRQSPDVRQMEAVLASADTNHPAAAPASTEGAEVDAAPAMSHAPAASAAPTAATAAGAVTATSAAGAAATSPRASTANHAAIIDEQHPSPRTQDAQQHLPPIVLATPGLLGAVPPAQSGNGAVVQDEAADMTPKPDQAVTKATPPDERKQPAPTAQQAQQDDTEPRPAAAASQAAPEPAPTPPSTGPQQSAKQSGIDIPRSPASAKARAAARVQPASAHGKPRKLARNGAKSRPAAAPAAVTSDNPADSDVALISAVIQHATKHPAANCADATCAAKATPSQ